MELGGFGKLHAPFFTERRTRGPSTAAWQEIRLPAGLMFSGRPYGPGSDLRFIAGYRTDSYGLSETSTLVPSVLYNFGAHSATTRYKNQFPTSHTSLYGNSKIELESDLGPEGR